MRLPDPVLRLFSYWQRHGFGATWRRAAVLLWRAFVQNGRVLFCCDLQSPEVARPAGISSGQLTIERLRGPERMGESDWQKIVSTRTAAVCRRLFGERFQRGASLWLVRCNGNLAGYGWALPCDSMERRYYPAGAKDVHLVEFLVFPEFRGLRINSFLVNHILGQLATEGKAHAYLDVAEWNKVALSSYRHTSLRPVGIWRGGPLQKRKLVKRISAAELWGEGAQQSEIENVTRGQVA